MSLTITVEEESRSADISKPSRDLRHVSSLPAQNVEPLWTVLHKMVPPRPNPGASVASWKFDDLRPVLLDAGQQVSVKEAERRVLMLVNPSLAAPCTTDTIYAGLQLILPGETAPAHRHVASALRFIVEGRGGFSAVEGEKISMERGDVILTPSWTWHDHGHEGDGPMIWLDGLDLPIFTLLRSNFAENYAEPRYPSVSTETSKLKIPWKSVAEKLDDAAGEQSGYACYHYHTNDGEHLSKTISAQAERVRAGTSSPMVQETCSFVYHVYEGRGYTDITLADGETRKRVSWTTGDTFSVPAWSAVSHTATSAPNAYLFAVNDRPMVECLGLSRRA